MRAEEFSPTLEAALRAAGLSIFGFLSRGRLSAACAGLPDELRSRYGIADAGGAVAAALAYGESAARPAWTAGYPGPLARIARFARANWYAELASRLGLAAERAAEALAAAGAEPGPAKAWRRLVNSRLPEKRLALEAGLGRLGRHGLVMIPGAGSAVVLGLLVAPSSMAGCFDSIGSPPLPGSNLLSPECETCSSCVAACPASALRGDGSLERELCLQHWSALPGDLPAPIEAAWGDRLYGCDACQEACPLFRPDPAARTGRGLLGPGLPASWLDEAPEPEIRSALRGSALDMGWISIAALRRNARNLTKARAAPRFNGTGGLDGKR